MNAHPHEMSKHCTVRLTHPPLLPYLISTLHYLPSLPNSLSLSLSFLHKNTPFLPHTFSFSQKHSPSLLHTLSLSFTLQAILPLRGKILNIEKASTDKIYQNTELQSLIAAIGLGVRGALPPSISSSRLLFFSSSLYPFILFTICLSRSLFLPPALFIMVYHVMLHSHTAFFPLLLFSFLVLCHRLLLLPH